MEEVRAMTLPRGRERARRVGCFWQYDVHAHSWSDSAETIDCDREKDIKYEGILEHYFDQLKKLEYPVRTTIRDGDSEWELVYRCGVLDRETEDASQTMFGMRTVMGEIRTASGHPFHALLDINTNAQNKLCGTRLVVPDDEDDKDEGFTLTCQGTPDFEASMAAIKATVVGFELFPYSYRYLDKSLWSNGHVDPETGWS